MKNRYIFLLFAAAACPMSGFAVEKADIPSPQARASVIKRGNALLEERKYKYDLEKTGLINPFAPNQGVVQKVETRSLRPSSDRDFLMLLANQLNPTGVLMLGDDALLLFGEKKVKVGESIKIPFDGQMYDIELVDLSRTAFTVKLNTELITRPIKQAKVQ